YARFSQAIALMPALNGYGTLTGTIDSSGSQNITEDNVAETFITSGLSKVMKINNICESGHLNDCGLTSGFTDLSGTSHSFPADMQALNSKMLNYQDGFASNAASRAVLNTKAAAFETANGESIALYYNPNCVASMNESSEYTVQPKICVNMIYDLNGSKGPNTIGKDMGTITILYPSDSVVVAPEPYRNLIENVSAENASRVCTTISSGNDYRLATREELAAFFINRNVWGLGGSTANYLVMSNSRFISQAWHTLWGMNIAYGIYQLPTLSDSWQGVCVKR
ncbi:MAG: hypothetical protein NC390_08300, partial [Fusobacterium sp.]|nr:hypothetical protein [Fusobacterium sp.]